MATLLDLSACGEVWKLDAGEPSRQEVRRIYVLPRLKKWMDVDLHLLAADWTPEQTPAEQLVAFLGDYCSGASLGFGTQFKPLTHLAAGIWQMKMPDLRLFGWFQMKDCFIAVDCDLASAVKRRRMYGPYCCQAVKYRNQLLLDEPKFMSGVDPDDVLSNFYYSQKTRSYRIHQ